MHTVKGRIKNGVVMADVALDNREGERVLITFLESAEQIAAPSVDEVVAKIAASGPSRDTYIAPKASLAERLAAAPAEEPIDPAEWDRTWAAIEAEIKTRDRADDEAEGAFSPWPAICWTPITCRRW
jgi:hypothetical protein